MLNYAGKKGKIGCYSKSYIKSIWDAKMLLKACICGTGAVVALSFPMRRVASSNLACRNIPILEKNDCSSLVVSGLEKHPFYCVDHSGLGLQDFWVASSNLACRNLPVLEKIDCSSLVVSGLEKQPFYCVDHSWLGLQDFSRCCDYKLRNCTFSRSIAGWSTPSRSFA
jgi:hypothetical protein